MHKLLLFSLFASFTLAADISTAIQSLRAVGPEALGNDDASLAWKVVSNAEPAQLTDLLGALDGANPLAENWLRAAVSAVDERSALAKATPIDALTSFIKDTKHSAGARALAFEILLNRAPTQANELSPTFLDDPSANLRRHPIKKLLDEADGLVEADKPKALALYKRALDAARDEDQIKPIAKKLRDMGEKVDLPKHFGFLMNWHLIAPFNNTEGTGHDTVYPPEKELDFKASYPGKAKTAAWAKFTSTDDYGKIDFNKPFGMEKEVTGYATTNFYTTERRDAEIRLGCKNAWKVWLNGKLLFARDEYHRGAQLDQYKLPCSLKKGRNTLLVKCSQNHQKEEWTVEWEFQLRICDSTGTAILSEAKSEPKK